MTGRGSKASIASTVSSARLKAMQEKAALEVRRKTLKKKQATEMARLKLKLEEEELNLTTELDTVEAKERALDSFEFQSNAGESDKHCGNNRSETATSGDNILLSVVRQLKRPIPEIKRFSGDPADYRKFIRQFNTKVAVHTENDDERLSNLEQFTTGEANRIVSGFSHLPFEQGYPAALKELESRNGDMHLMAHSFIKKALDWPCVRPDNQST
ncbi:uncharacterized protein LOC110988797 [Acanthaster planci]|uniref:Uncharacterized protein LOC110988797 n=1 Tax=Acanthaster planci TaxID=133434 RepID=A0A8B7ZXP9_ACAPL|nr:uncharacterized protein LOC110988797 [Acanthaster planci]